MSEWNELIDRLTHRLVVDEELRLDVARELRCHLEDAAVEFRGAGQSEQQAAASAARALGDADELAEQLWQANRRRIRIRGVIRWAARVTLLPAAAAIVLVFLLYIVNVGNAFFPGKYGYRGWYPGGWDGKTAWPMGPVGELVLDPYMGVHLSQDQRFMLFGAPGAQTALERAKSISDRWPDNPVYYANYVAFLLSSADGRGVGESGGGTDAEKLSAVVAALRKGEQLDPCNAFYPFEVASLLIRASSKVSEDPNRAYGQVSVRGDLRQAPACKTEVTDAALFRSGLEEFRRGLGTPQFTSHALDILRLRLAGLPAPTRLIQYLARLDIAFSTPLPYLGDYRHLTEALLGRAMDLAEQGQGAQAIRLAREVELMGDTTGGRSDTFVIQLLVGARIRSMAIGHAELIYGELGQADKAADARRRQQEDAELYRHVWAGKEPGPEEMAGMGLLESITRPVLPGYDASMLRPIRTAEWFLAAQAGLLVLLAALLAGSLVLAVVAGLELWLLPRERRPVLLFVGWRRLGRICVLAVVVPVAVYGLYALAAAEWGPTAGLTGALLRVGLELALLAVVVFVLLAWLSGSAIRQRAAELGLDAPGPATWRQWAWPAGLMVLGAALPLIIIVGWWTGAFRTYKLEGISKDVGGILYSAAIACTVVPWGIAWALWSPAPGGSFKRFRQSVRRSMVPILAAAVVVVGIGLGGLLAAGEGLAISRMGRGLPMPDEIRNSDLRLIQEHLAQAQQRQLQGELFPPAASPSP